MSCGRTVRLKDIADAAGVAVATASAALNGTGTVSASMRERVRKVAREMNYEPNLAAKLLKQKQSSDLGLIISDLPERIFGSGYFMPMISNFIRQCEAEELRCQIEYHDPGSSKLPALLTNGQAGGVLHGGTVSPVLREWLGAHPDFPFIALEEEYVNNLTSDYELAFYKAVQYLVALGHRRFGLVTGPREYRRQAQIENGFLRAVNEFSLEFHPGRWSARLELKEDAGTLRGAVEFSRKLFAQREFPSAVICSDGRAAKGVLFAACEAGLRVPEQFSLLACSSQTESEQTYPPISSVAWNAPEAIFRGIYMLKNLMKGLALQDPNPVIEPAMTIRGTTARCPE
ncbi:MAG: LacI family DNA-binding transcriptional regulator [Lentisphaeria bacterium]|nr:LacI family DNA-binding transcriptional regulator [Lentisphaeria bacterium]